MQIKHVIKKAARLAGLDVRRYVPQDSAPVFPDIPDGNLYVPFYSPWWSSDYLKEYSKIKPYTLVSEDRSYILATLATQSAQLDGEIWECGVYKGGTAMLLAGRLAGRSRTLRLFDTFVGMPETDAVRDLHKAGDFADTSADSVKQRVAGDFVRVHQGLIPETFKGLESSRIAFAHVDVDIYRAVQACCEFIFPRLCAGGIMVFDDYGFASCPGARAAVDEYFEGIGVRPLAMPTGQAIVFNPVASPRRDVAGRDAAVQTLQHETHQPA